MLVNSYEWQTYVNNSIISAASYLSLYVETVKLLPIPYLQRAVPRVAYRVFLISCTSKISWWSGTCEKEILIVKINSKQLLHYNSRKSDKMYL